MFYCSGESLACCCHKYVAYDYNIKLSMSVGVASEVTHAPTHMPRYTTLSTREAGEIIEEHETIFRSQNTISNANSIA